jgi:hypothetical protein
MMPGDLKEPIEDLAVQINCDHDNVEVRINPLGRTAPRRAALQQYPSSIVSEASRGMQPQQTTHVFPANFNWYNMPPLLPVQTALRCENLLALAQYFPCSTGPVSKWRHEPQVLSGP